MKSTYWICFWLFCIWLQVISASFHLGDIHKDLERIANAAHQVEAPR